MRTLVTIEQRYWKTPAGRVVGVPPCTADYQYLARYRASPATDQVLVVARVAPTTDGHAENYCDGHGVEFCELPAYHGPYQYLLNIRTLQHIVQGAVDLCDTFIIHAPGLVAGLVWKEVRRRKLDYAVEVVGDPWDVYAHGAVKSFTRPLARRIQTSELYEMCKGAIAVNYVTKRTLQSRYPARPNAIVTTSSDVMLPDESFDCEVLRRRLLKIDNLRRTRSAAPSLVIGNVGSFAQLYKGQHVLVRALAQCREQGCNISLEFAGQGEYLGATVSLARKLGVADAITFHGALDWKHVIELLDSWDVFVLPSLTEGLPRAVIEAMSRACPAIASRVGGVPELLLPDDMVQPRDTRALAEKIIQVCGDPDRMELMALRNWEASKEFAGTRQIAEWERFISHTTNENSKT